MSTSAVNNKQPRLSMSRPSALYTFLKPKAVAVEEPVVELPTSPTLDQSVQTRILLQSSAINTLLDGFVSKVDASAEQLQDLSNQVKEQQSFNAVVSADQEKRAKVFEAECSARDERLQAGLERLQNTVEIQGESSLNMLTANKEIVSRSRSGKCARSDTQQN